MKKSVLIAAVFVLLHSHSLFSQGVTLFWDGNFSGPSIVIEGDWDANSNMKWNDQISSIRIPAGYKIQVFEHTNFGGASKILSGDWTVPDGNFNDYISSIKILEYPRKGVVVYRDGRYQGQSLEITSDWDASSDMSWNDQISSIRIPAGYKIQVFEHTNFGGISKILTGDWTVTDGSFNDFISSIKILEYPHTGVVLYRDANFQGASVEITTDWDATSDMDWNDQISSIKIPAGTQIQVFEHIEFGGESRILSKDWTTAGDDFNDMISSIKFLPTAKPAPTVMPASATDRLCCEQRLQVGAMLESFNRRFFLTLQDDRNLVLYMRSANGDKPLWATGTNNNADLVTMQADGNLVVYNGTRAVWASNTTGNYNASLVVQDDGNLVIYAAGNRPVWSTNTSQPVQELVVTPAVPTAPPCDMSDHQFNAAVQAIKSQSFRDEKMKMAKQATKNKCLSLQQVRAIGKLFAFEDQTLDFLKYAYEHTNNKDEYYTLSDIFTFKSNADNFMKFLNSK